MSRVLPAALLLLLQSPLASAQSYPSWWQKRNVSCLQPFKAGCSAIEDEHTCLSSRDGSFEADVQGLKIHNEACVWCGGGNCYDGGDGGKGVSVKCAPFDFLLRGEGTAFDTFTAEKTYRVATCGVALPNYDYSCLAAAGSGCGSIRDAGTCLGSKDGRDMTSLNGLLVKGQPCVWCGGLPCHAGESELCEPFDFASSADSQAGFPTKRTLRLGACRNSRPAAYMIEGLAMNTPGYLAPPLGSAKLVPSWVPTKPSEVRMSCLKTVPGGCSSLKTAESCLSSRDGGDTENIEGLQVRGEPCVWCGGTACHSGNLENLCEPFDYVMMGEGVAFTTFLAKPSFSVASCSGEIPKPPFDYQCLKEEPNGCKSLMTKSACISSLDGSATEMEYGLRIKGQPCVWCMGHDCHSAGHTYCEAFDWVVNGAGRAFNQFYAKLQFQMAGCTDGVPMAHNYFGPVNDTNSVPDYQWAPPNGTRVPPGGQCGGRGYNGSTTCVDGYTCHYEDLDHSFCARMAGFTTTEVPYSPPDYRLGADCFHHCSPNQGSCSWCGPNQGCCRQGWSTPSECAGASGFKSLWRHECVRLPAPTAPPPIERAAPVVQPVPTVVIPGFRNVTEGNVTNITTEGLPPEERDWVLIGILLFLVCCMLPLLGFFIFRRCVGSPKKKKSSRTRFPRLSGFQPALLA